MKMKMLMLAMASGIIFFSSCKKDDENSSVTPEPAMEEDDFFCTTDDWDYVTGDHKGAKINGAFYKNFKWDKGATIKVKFLDGSAWQQKQVRETLTQWDAIMSLSFKYVGKNDIAHVKVTFKEKGNWGKLGFGANEAVAQNKPSVSLAGIVPEAPKYARDRKILHEFGHVIGLVHEHQSPNAKIQWDEYKLKKYFEGTGQKWETVYNNYVKVYTTDQVKTTAFDKYSIMLYPIPQNLYKNKNLDLSYTRWSISAGDREIVSALYPKNPHDEL